VADDVLVIELVEAEACRGFEQYGPFSSAHEALGVLLEEFNELAEAVRGNSLAAVHREAVQVAAVAYRLAMEAYDEADEEFKKRSRLW
jgi:NTP pyrophosphatase (non-canonical NTP hydrolase)